MLMCEGEKDERERYVPSESTLKKVKAQRKNFEGVLFWERKRDWSKRQESKRAREREQESKRARERESERAREQESKRAREQDSKIARE
jgi:hypothetical protein